MTLECSPPPFFFLKQHSLSFYFQYICQIQNVNSHLIVLDPCFKVPLFSFFLFLSAESCLKKNCYQKFPVLKNVKEKIRICLKTVHQQLPKHQAKRTKRSLFFWKYALTLTKMHFTEKVKNSSKCSSGWYLLSCWACCSQTWYGNASSWARVSCKMSGLLSSSSGSQWGLI